MSKTLSMALIAFVTMSQAAAATDISPLTAGKPAGVRQAQLGGSTLIYIAGAGALAAVVAILSSSGSNNVTTNSTTGTGGASTTP